MLEEGVEVVVLDRAETYRATAGGLLLGTGEPPHHTAMLESIRSYFQKRMRPEAAPDPETASADGATDADTRRLHLAACALLLELAHADDQFTEDERIHIEAVMRRHFGLDEATALELMDLAESERADAIDLYQFTSLIRQNYDLGQKTLLAEIMWGLILTDGKIAEHEAYMLRKIANLLDLQPGYLSAAKKRAADKA